MKILYLSAAGRLGGAEKMLLDLLASVRAAQPGWTLGLVAGEDGALIARARELGVQAVAVPFPRALARLGDAGAGGPAGRAVSRAALCGKLLTGAPYAIRYAHRLRSALADFAPDVIHSNSFKMHVLGAFARPRGVPVVWHVHDYVGSRPVMARVMRLAAGRCRVAVTNSESVAADVRAVCGARLEVRSIYNAVNLRRFAPSGATLDLDALAGLPPAAPRTVRVGLLATLARWKGHQTFLRALSLLPPELRVRGYVVGGALYQTDGSQHTLEDLRSFAAQLGVADRVGFTGYVEESAAVMRSLDIVVHASTQPEPFGLVIAEAMACGRAVIASDAGGASELFDAGRDALAHPPGDAAALARRIAELAGDADLRARLGREGRATAERRFDHTRLAADIIPVYERLRRERAAHGAVCLSVNQTAN